MEMLDVSIDTVRAHVRLAMSGLEVETLDEALSAAARLRYGQDWGPRSFRTENPSKAA